MQNEAINGRGYSTKDRMDTMLTVADIATIMGYSTHRVRIMINSGVFPRIHRSNLGDGKKGHIRIYRSDFERWREESTDHAFEEE